MTPKRWWITGAALAALLGSAFLIFGGKSEPSYEGRTVSGWLRTGNYREIDTALARIGPAAIPALVRAAHEQDSPVSKAWQWLWRKLPRSVQTKFAHFQPIPASRIQSLALDNLVTFGDEAQSACQPVLPGLIQQAQHETNIRRRLYLDSLIMFVGRESPAARAHVLRELRQRRWGAQFADSLVQTIQEMRFRLPAAVPVLMQHLDAQNGSPVAADLALAVQGAAAQPAIPLLVNQLQGSKVIRYPLYPLLALADIGTGLGPAVPSLIHLLHEGDPQLRPYILQVLMEAGPVAAPALPALTATLRNSKGIDLVLAAVAMARIQQKPDLAVAPLIWELSVPDQPPTPASLGLPPGVSIAGSPRGYFEPSWQIRSPETSTPLLFIRREAAAWYLGELGPAAAAAVPALTTALHDSDPAIPPLAARALFKITGRSDVALPTLLACLKSKDRQVCTLATVALAAMGPAARTAIPALHEVQTRSLELREAARLALQRIQSPSEFAQP